MAGYSGKFLNISGNGTGNFTMLESGLIEGVNATFTGKASVVPEPTSVLLVGSGMAAIHETCDIHAIHGGRENLTEVVVDDELAIGEVDGTDGIVETSLFDVVLIGHPGAMNYGMALWMESALKLPSGNRLNLVRC